MDARALVRPRGPQGPDEGADVSVKQLRPLDRLGPQVQVTLLEQEVLFVLDTSEKGVWLLVNVY